MMTISYKNRQVAHQHETPTARGYNISNRCARSPMVILSIPRGPIFKFQIQITQPNTDIVASRRSLASRMTHSLTHSSFDFEYNNTRTSTTTSLSVAFTSSNLLHLMDIENLTPLVYIQQLQQWHSEAH